MTRERQGILFGLTAYVTWGLFPLYFPLLKPASALEILAHRVLWTLVFVLVLLALRRRWAWVEAIVRDRRRLLILSVASLVIAVNWGVYVWAVNHGHVVEAALGYYINPLVTVLLGVVLLHERLRRWQWVAVGLGGLAVLVLAVDVGQPPWVALVLAFSFATYGLMKNQVRMPAVESLAVETTMLVLPALVVVAAVTSGGQAAFGHPPLRVTVLMVGMGVVTAVPLLLFGAAASRVPLSTMGLMQYITPTLQFVIGLSVAHEQMSAGRWFGFFIVWLALLVFSLDSLRHSTRASSILRDHAATPRVSP
jgi:chloramphenicol-sensitive protein RarD